MPRGTQKKLDEFGVEAGTLSALGKNCRFRMVRRKRNFVIRILDYKPVWDKQRKTPLEFGTEFAWQNKLGWTTEAEIEQIRACADLCRKSHAAGYWLGTTYEERRKASSSTTLPTGGVLNWGTFADRIEAYVHRQPTKIGSKKNYIGFLNTFRTWQGAVTSTKISSWLAESVSIGALNNRRDFISLINKSGFMDLNKDYQKLKERIAALKGPEGHQKEGHQKQREKNRQKPRAIPSDVQIEAWLDSMSDVGMRTTFALICTYGLRPHEVWHIDWLRESGIGHIRFGKTGDRTVAPVPARWAQKYKLSENLGKAQAWMHAHAKVHLKPWPKAWADMGLQGPVFKSGDKLKPWILSTNGVEDCENRPELGDQVAAWMKQVGTPDLWGETPEGETSERQVMKNGVIVNESRARSYCPRHAFAIRCYLSPETSHEADTTFAKWMGHDVAVHVDTYRRWMPVGRVAQAEEEAQQRRQDRLAESTLDVYISWASKQEARATSGEAALAMDEQTLTAFQAMQKADT